MFVSNQNAKIEARKVFYKSNRGSKDTASLAFSSDIPLWPGSNQVTVIARENTDVKTIQSIVIYRDSPKTAAAAPAAP